ncbi:MAG: efflux RND transporter permease subunit [Opitutales bacterium]|nr:efflux RND transporter permease subunit [Opitutales bacterium]
MESQPVKGGIIAWFTQNPVAANLLMFGIVFMGVLSLGSIKKEFFPTTTLESVTVEVAYPGAAPEEVEEGIVVKIEEAVQDLDGIDEMTSTASEGFGSVRIDIKEGYNISDFVDKVKMRVDAISTFPDLAERPVVYENTITSLVCRVQIYGDLDEASLKELARDVRDEIINLPEVTQAEVSGTRDYELAVEVSEENLQKYGLTFGEVVTAVRNSSVDLPGGSIKTKGGDFLLRTKGQAYVGHEFEKIVLRTREDGTRLLLRDVANIVDGFTDSDLMIRFNGYPTVAVNVNRVGDESTLDVARAVRDYVAMKEDVFPDNIHIAVWNDFSVMLNSRFELMYKNGLLGGILVFLSLALFLRMKLAIWVAMGLPICFLGAIAFMPIMDVSINMISLFAFILVLGIVVDDAIVIGENVYTISRKEGHSVANVIRGAQEVAMPATFGVLTTIAAFIPIMMIPGVQGKMWIGIAVVVILCLTFSLIESKLILPAHLAHTDFSLKPMSEMGMLSRFQRRFADGLHVFVDRYYKPVLGLAVAYRYATFALFIGMALLTAGLFGSGIIRFVFFPNIEGDYPSATLEMVEGTPYETTENAVLQLEAAAYRAGDLLEKKYGEKAVKSLLSLSYNSTIGNIWMELTPSEERSFGATEFVNLWRSEVGPIPGVKELNLTALMGRNSGSMPISVDLISDDYVAMDRAADEIKGILGNYGGVFDVSDSHGSGKQEIRVKLLPAGEALGLTLSDIGSQIRYAFYGAEAQRIQRGKDEVKVMIRYPENERRSVSSLLEMRVRTADGTEVPFASVAEVDIGRGYSSIDREDRHRLIRVVADVDKDTVEPSAVMRDLAMNYLPAISAKYPSIRIALSGESEDQSETLGALGRGALLAMFVIYALMAVPLKSYVKPLIIMSVIPFGIVGAILGHFIVGIPVSILSLTGVIALAGVVVNDSLVMVDYVNNREAEGLSKHDAVMAAGPARFRAILLTSLTTFFGLVPMILERSMQAQFLKPMAVSLAFGIVFSTIITLVLIPALYIILEDFSKIKKTIF